jgi:hypothetical protein
VSLLVSGGPIYHVKHFITGFVTPESWTVLPEIDAKFYRLFRKKESQTVTREIPELDDGRDDTLPSQNSVWVDSRKPESGFVYVHVSWSDHGATRELRECKWARELMPTGTAWSNCEVPVSANEADLKYEALPFSQLLDFSDGVEGSLCREETALKGKHRSEPIPRVDPSATLDQQRAAFASQAQKDTDETTREGNSFAGEWCASLPFLMSELSMREEFSPLGAVMRHRASKGESKPLCAVALSFHDITQEWLFDERSIRAVFGMCSPGHHAMSMQAESAQALDFLIEAGRQMELESTPPQ